MTPFSLVPSIAWLREYRGESLRSDIVAGLTAAAVVIPKAMAYATIAGLPLQVGERWGSEIKSGLVPKLERGFHQARADLQPARAFVVYSGNHRYPHSEGVEAIGLSDLCGERSAL